MRGLLVRGVRVTEPSAHQYFCRQCGYERDGLLDHAAGIGGYSWACPQCKSHHIGSREVKMTKQGLTHPVDILKDLGVRMTPEVEAEARRVCDELTIICPQCDADVIKELGCNGCSSSCPIAKEILSLGAATCEYCRQGLPLTMGIHRQGKGGPTWGCAYYGKRQPEISK